MAFKDIPVLDLSDADSPATKPEFLSKLRDCLLNVGFLYIKNFGIEAELCDKVCEEGIKFFDLPDEEKLRIEMKQKPSFLGYSRVSAAYEKSSDMSLNSVLARQRDHCSECRLAGADRSEYTSSTAKGNRPTVSQFAVAEPMAESRVTTRVQARLR